MFITLARPYAKAIFEIANQEEKLLAWESWLQTIALFLSDKSLQYFLNHPRFSEDARCDCLVQIMKNYKPVELSDEKIKFFLKLLANKKRLLLLPFIATLFTQLRNEQERTIDVEVISAAVLTQAQKDFLKNTLTIRLQKHTVLHERLEPALIGGLIIRAGDWVIDGSLRSKLFKLHDALIN